MRGIFGWALRFLHVLTKQPAGVILLIFIVLYS